MEGSVPKAKRNMRSALNQLAGAVGGIFSKSKARREAPDQSDVSKPITCGWLTMRGTRGVKNWKNRCVGNLAGTH